MELGALRRLPGRHPVLADQPVVGERVGADDALQRVAKDVRVVAAVEPSSSSRYRRGACGRSYTGRHTVVAVRRPDDCEHLRVVEVEPVNDAKARLKAEA